MVNVTTLESKIIRLFLLTLVLGFTGCHNKLPVTTHSIPGKEENGLVPIQKLESQITVRAQFDDFEFAGTPSGLYKIDSKTKYGIIVEKLAEFNVRYIIREGDNILRLNDGLRYDISNNLVSGTYKKDNIKAVRQTDKLILAQLFDETLLLIKENDTTRISNYTGESLDNVVFDKEYIWIPVDLRKGIYRYSIGTGNLDLIKIGYDFRNYSVQGNDSLLLITNNEGVLEFNKNNHKAYFVKSGEDQQSDSDKVDVTKLILQETPFFSYVSEELTLFTGGDIRSSYEKFLEINSRFQKSPNKRIQDKLTELKASLPALLPYSFDQAKTLERFCTDTVRDNDVIAGFYLHMIKMAIYEGRLKDALYYDGLLSNKYPDSGNEAHTSIIQKVKQTDAYLSSLSKDLPEDEYLWLTGKAYYDLFLVAGPVGKGNINMTFPFSFLKKLKKNFPAGNYADNADYLMLSHIEGMASGDANLYQKVLKEYKALMLKYPTSELQPHFMERFAKMAFHYKPEDGNRIKYLEESQKYLTDLQNAYPAYFRDNNIQSLSMEVEEGLSKCRWKFSVDTRKKSLNLNEPVVLTFTMTNIDSIPKALKVSDDAGIPNFIISVQHYGLYADYLIEELTIQPDFRYYIKSVSDTSVAPGASYSETWNIRDRARNSFSQPAGKFVFNQAGRYKITCQPINDSFSGFIKPETITITLSEKEQGSSPF